MEMIKVFKRRKQSPAVTHAKKTKTRQKIYDARNINRIFDSEFSGLAHFGGKLLSALARELDLVQGIFLLYDDSANPPLLKYLSGYACNLPDPTAIEFGAGEGLPGQALEDAKILNLKNIPEGYIKIKTGLGEAFPGSLLLMPLIDEDGKYGVIELASFRNFNAEEENLLKEFAGKIIGKIKELKAT